MEPGVSIKRLSFPGDGALLEELHRMYDREYGFTREPGEYGFIVDYVSKHSDIYTCVAVMKEDRPVGYGRCYERVSTSSCDRVLMLDIVEIAKAHRGKGLGKMLVAEIMKIAAERDCARVDLLADVENETAIGLYSSFGFKGRKRMQMHRFIKDKPDLVAYFEKKKKKSE